MVVVLILIFIVGIAGAAQGEGTAFQSGPASGVAGLGLNWLRRGCQLLVILVSFDSSGWRGKRTRAHQGRASGGSTARRANGGWLFLLLLILTLVVVGHRRRRSGSGAARRSAAQQLVAEAGADISELAGGLALNRKRGGWCYLSFLLLVISRLGGGHADRG